MKKIAAAPFLAAIFVGLASQELFSGLPQGIVFGIVLSVVLCGLYATVWSLAAEGSNAEQRTRLGLLGLAALVSVVIQTLLGMFYFARFQWSAVGMFILWAAPPLLVIAAFFLSLRGVRRYGAASALLIAAIAAQLILAALVRY